MKLINTLTIRILHRKYFFGHTKPHPGEFGKHIALRRPLGIRENRADVEIDRDSNSNILGIHKNGLDHSTTPAWVPLKIQFALLFKKCTVLVVSIYSTSQVGTPRVCTVFVHVKGIVLRLNINF